MTSGDHPLETKLAAAWPGRCRKMTVLAAVSGGADSVALVRALRASAADPARLVVGHFNHRLRAAESDGDQAFVEQLCQRLGVECLVGRVEAATSDAAATATESNLRSERYAFLQQAAQQVGARYLATAHTRDDQAETVLHHVLRGTGLAGLAGMPRWRSLGEAVTLVRPLLDVSRAEVLDFLTALGQPFREDASNAERRFTRNRLRHDLLPQLERDYGGGVADSLLRLAAVAGDAQAAIERAAGELLDLRAAHGRRGADRTRLSTANARTASLRARVVRRALAPAMLAATRHGISRVGSIGRTCSGRQAAEVDSARRGRGRTALSNSR